MYDFFSQHQTETIFLFAYKNILWIILQVNSRFLEVYRVVAISINYCLRFVSTQCIPPIQGKSYDYLSRKVYLPILVF